MFRTAFVWMNRYERHLSAAAMVGGFVLDYLYFGRIDIWQTQTVFLAYAATCLISIPLLHYLEARAERGRGRPRWRPLLPIATQFALGGFWSGFLIFYSRSAVVSSSWPFLLLIFGIFFGNEILKKYHERLVFTSVLFFFALYSYAIFAVPIVTGTLGTGTFLISGAVAVGIFTLFTMLLRILGRTRFLLDIYHIRIGAFVVLVIINVCYFTSVLPPLPLAARSVGLYHTVTHAEGAYTALEEAEPWRVRYLGLSPTLHIENGGSVYAYTSVFAPTSLDTTIVHRWQWQDPATGTWDTRFALTYPIEGGADGGYRGYSAIVPKVAGHWRVSVETVDGRLIARLPFTLVFVEEEPSLTKRTLP